MDKGLQHLIEACVWSKLERMFDDDLSALPTADLLESAAQHRAEINRLEARLLEHAQHFADQHHPTTSPPRPRLHDWEGRERSIVLGGDGCPEITEFAPAEFGAVLGMSTGAAAGYIGQALALRHRFPFIWARVQSGDATPWRAAKISTACEDLSLETAAMVDRRLAPIVDTVTPYRLDKIIKAAQWHADPAAARAAAEEKARERGVYVGDADDHGTKILYVRAATGDIIRFDATITSIADALHILGDTTALASRRAKAIGIIADPHYTAELLLQAREHIPAPLTANPTEPQPDDEPGANNRPRTNKPDTPLGPHNNAAPAEPGPAEPRPGDLRLGGPSAGHGRGRDGSRRHEPVRDRLDLRELDLSGPDPDEPGTDDEADRDAPHPSSGNLPDPLDTPPRRPPLDPTWPTPTTTDPGEPLDADAQRALDARLAHIRQTAHTRRGTDTATRTGAALNPARTQLRPAHTQVYIHLTDHTLATGTGILRVENLGPMLADQLTELIGHAPYTVKPVIDLNESISVDAYEIPTRIRERVKLTHPIELFPYGARETTHTIDLDHIRPYNPAGPPGQTSTDNLAPLGRRHHRIKTHSNWNVRRLDQTTVEWTTPNGFTFHVTPTGTHRVATPEAEG
ncbi:DUF222 domain-containing protein [Kribbella sp. NBC_00889]|uniref:DUF222 domain-containing protein n=1 Tax=Kribbella sp. NBC_00889 TaxID=2975974 RepID=UPI00386FE45E|nr:hypothetical protein OG817_32165 [Kribbella sp. NBC_00889]